MQDLLSALNIPSLFTSTIANAHTSGDVKRYFQEKEIEVIDWPSQSPDLNLIESVWSQLKYNLKRSYQNLEDLQEDIISSSQSIDCFYIKKLYSSMKNRLQAVIDNNGGPTKY